METRTIRTSIHRPPSLPQGIVTEFMGGIEFSKDAENDVAIAEQIASQDWPDMSTLVAHCRDEAHNKKAFDKYIKGIKNNPYFKKYF